MCTLSLIRRSSATLAAASLAAACSTTPQARVADRLDPDTGTTVVVLANPPQLVTTENRGPSRDPFAFAAPFDVDRMGNRELYLWVSLPEDNGTPSRVRVLCADQPLQLAPVQLDLGRLQLSRPPYPQVAPWTGDWYFRMPAAALDCLASTRRMTVESTVKDSDGEHEERFTANGADLQDFTAFAAHLRGP